MESFAFKLIFGFVLTAFSPTQLGAEELFLPNTLTMQSVFVAAQTNENPPAKPADEKKEDLPLFAAIPNRNGEELAEWCRAHSNFDVMSDAPTVEQPWRPRSPLGKLRIKGGANRLNMNLV